ncbi:MAG: SRPBCC family protein [Phycisphaerales bacterium]
MRHTHHPIATALAAITAAGAIALTLTHSLTADAAMEPDAPNQSTDHHITPPDITNGAHLTTTLGVMAVTDPDNYDHDAAIVAEALLNADPTRVWKLLTTEEGVADWLIGRSDDGQPNCNIELRVGGPYELFFAPDAPEGQRGADGCTITSFLPNRMLSFTWNAPPIYPEQRTLRTWVVIELEQVPSQAEWEANPRTGEFQTRLRLTHLGWPADGLAAEVPPLPNGYPGGWPGVRAYFQRAWPNVVTALKNHCASN